MDEIGPLVVRDPVAPVSIRVRAQEPTDHDAMIASLIVLNVLLRGERHVQGLIIARAAAGFLELGADVGLPSSARPNADNEPVSDEYVDAGRYLSLVRALDSAGRLNDAVARFKTQVAACRALASRGPARPNPGRVCRRWVNLYQRCIDALRPLAWVPAGEALTF